MLKLIKGLLGVVERENVSAADLATPLNQADAEVSAAAAAQEAAEAAYRDGLLKVDDPGLARLDAARTEARLRVDRANAVRTALGEKRAAAVAHEDEAQRRAAYDAAASQAAEAREILTTLYPAAAADIVRIITAVAAAEIAVRAANADLPVGAPKLPRVESVVRDVSRERRLVSERTVTRWCREGEKMPGIDQSQVIVNTQGHGYLQPPRGQIEYLVVRKYIERVYEEGNSKFAYDLATKVNLPGLGANDVPFWQPLSSGTEPVYVIRAAEELAAQGSSVGRRDLNPQIKTELTLIDTFDPNETARPGGRP